MSGVSKDYVTDIERLLRHVASIIRRRGRDILSVFGITTPQFNALLALKDNPNITMGDLCEKLFLACSTATDLVDRMEKHGFLVRHRDPQDRRVIRLSITEKGLKVISEVMKARLQYVSSILDNLKGEEKDQLVATLGRLHSLMVSEKVN